MTVQSARSNAESRRLSSRWLSMMGALAILAGTLLVALVLVFSSKEEARVDREYLVTQRAQSLSALVAAGRYDFVNPAVTTQNFSVESKPISSVLVELVPLASEGKNATVKEAIAHLKEKGYRPATVSELLALGEQYPKVQAGVTIVAAGSIWTTGSHTAVAALTGYTDSRDKIQRMLEVFGAGVLGFRTNVVFAAVKN